MLAEFLLREFYSTSAAILAPTTAWWLASNEPGGMRKEFSW